MLAGIPARHFFREESESGEFPMYGTVFLRMECLFLL